jgi:ribonuclease Z
MMPYPYPTSAAAAVAAGVPPKALTADDLHLRLIMQALVNQISAVWNGPECADHVISGPEQHRVRLAVPARDFMVVRVPSHELTDSELEAMHAAREEIVEVTRSWACFAGAYVGTGEERRWVGYEPEPAGDRWSVIGSRF